MMSFETRHWWMKTDENWTIFGGSCLSQFWTNFNNFYIRTKARPWRLTTLYRYELHVRTKWETKELSQWQWWCVMVLKSPKVPKGKTITFAHFFNGTSASGMLSVWQWHLWHSEWLHCELQWSHWFAIAKQPQLNQHAIEKGHKMEFDVFVHNSAMPMMAQ